MFFKSLKNKPISGNTSAPLEQLSKLCSGCAQTAQTLWVERPLAKQSMSIEISLLREGERLGWLQMIPIKEEILGN